MADLKSNHLAVMLPEQLRAAIEFAALRRFTSASEYTRQAVVDRLRADGVEPTQVSVSRSAELKAPASFHLTTPEPA